MISSASRMMRSISSLHVGTALLASPKSHPRETDIQRMDLASWLAHKKRELLRDGALQPALADHPGVTAQLAEAYRKHFGVA